MAKSASISGGDRLSKKLDQMARGKPDVAGVRVGIVKSAKYPVEVGKGRPKRTTSPTIAQVALWNEFGTKGGGWGGPIPERPFMRNSVTQYKKDERIKLLLKVLVNPKNPNDLRAATGMLGNILKDIMVEQLSNGMFQPNAPTTIAIKGSSKPLIDLGYLRRAIEYQIIKTGSKEDLQKTTPITGRGL